MCFLGEIFKNFDLKIFTPEKIVEVGEIDPDMFAVAGVLVDAIAEGEKPWQI